MLFWLSGVGGRSVRDAGTLAVMIVYSGKGGLRYGMFLHQMTVRIIPLLSGRWYFSVKCGCGEERDGTAVGHERAEEEGRWSLPCSGEVHKVMFQTILSQKTAERLLGQAGRSDPVVLDPFGQLMLEGNWSPKVIAVDASWHPGDGFAGMAAVSGGGWVRLNRMVNAVDFDTHRAEFMALVAAFEMLPAGSEATVYSDRQSLVSELNVMKKDKFKSAACRKRLSPSIADKLAVFFDERDVTLRWRPRNSNGLMRLADRLSRLSRRSTLEYDELFAMFDWKRQPSLPDQPELVQRRECQYYDSAGQLVRSELL